MCIEPRLRRADQKDCVVATQHNIQHVRLPRNIIKADMPHPFDVARKLKLLL